MIHPLRVVSLALVAFLLVLLPLSAGDAHGAEGIKVETLPAVPGFPLTIDGRTVMTDGSGAARFPITDVHNLSDRVKLHERTLMLDGKRVRVVASRAFVRSGRVTVAVDVHWSVRFSYADLSGRKVQTNAIQKVRIKSSTGEVRIVKPGQPVWLQGSRVVPLSGGLENKKIYWTLQEVQYAGSNVVNASQQRFRPAHRQKVKFRLLFYQTEVKVKDAFFGFGTGYSVKLTYPDNSEAAYPLTELHNVTLPSLPRGDYVIVVDGPGPRMSRPVAVSRDQLLDLKFYSWLDIGITCSILALFALGTLAVGLRRRVAHRRASTAERPRREYPGPKAGPDPTDVTSWAWWPPNYPVPVKPVAARLRWLTAVERLRSTWGRAEIKLRS